MRPASATMQRVGAIHCDGSSRGASFLTIHRADVIRHRSLKEAAGHHFAHGADGAGGNL